MTWSIREIWRATVAGFFVGRVELYAETNNVPKMRRYAKKALEWADGPHPRFGAHVANASVEALDGDSESAKYHIQAAHKCIEEEPEIRDYRELRATVAELRRLEDVLCVPSDS